GPGFRGRRDPLSRGARRRLRSSRRRGARAAGPPRHLPRRDPRSRRPRARGGAARARTERARREARPRGVERSDVVVRRHLVDMMRLTIGRPAPSDLPAAAELQAYLVAHADVFAEPPALRLAHVYLSDAARGAAAAGDATALLDMLRRTGAGPEAAARAGAPFIRRAERGPRGVGGPARIFGWRFAAPRGGPPRRRLGGSGALDLRAPPRVGTRAPP